MMKLKILFLLFLSGALHAEAPLVLTLSDCIILTLKNHPAVKKYSYVLKQYEERIRQKRIDFYPEISMKAQYTRQYQEASGRQSDYYGLSLSLNQLIFNGFQRLSAFHQARLNRNLAREEMIQAVSNLVYTVKETVFALDLYAKQVLLLKKGIERRKEDLIIIRLKYSGGKESLVSVKEMESDVRDAEVSLMEKEQQIQVLSEFLNLMIQRPEADPVQIHLASESVSESLAPEWELLQKARFVSYDFRRIQLLTEIESQITLSLEGEFFPQFSFYGGLGLGEETFFPTKKSWNLGLSIQIPLSSGFSTASKIRESENRQFELLEDLKAAEIQLRSDLKKAVSRYKILQEKIRASKEKYEAAQDSYELTRLSYQQGNLSYQWLKQKENELLTLELSRETLEYDLRIQRAEIEKMTQEVNLEKFEN